VTKNFRRFAQDLMKEDHKENKPSFFSRLFGSN
jgi:hypothetical protein